MKIVIIFLSFLLWAGMSQKAAVANEEAAQYLNAARISMHNEGWAQAEDRLLNLVKLNFNDVNARYLLGVIAEERGNLRLARNRYKMALLIDNTHLLTLVACARIAEKLHSNDILAAYQRLITREPDHVLWHLKVAQLYMQNKSIKAERYLNNVLNIEPNNRQALQLMIQYHQHYAIPAHAKVYQQRLRDLDAFVQQEQARVKKKEVIISLPIVSAQASTLPSKVMDAARIHMQHHQWLQAETLLLELIKRNFKHVEARFLLAQSAEQRGELRLAKKRYKMVSFMDKKHQSALIGWVRVAEKLHSYDVLFAYQGLIKLEPDHVLWHVKVAQFYMQHKPLRAKHYIKQALSIDPDHRQALKLMIAYQKKYGSVAQSKPFQSRLNKKNDKPNASKQQEKTLFIARKEVIKPNLDHFSEDVIHARKQHLASEVIAVSKIKTDTKKLTDVRVFQQYTELAKQGRAGDQYMLGLMYHEGRGVALNDVQAVALIKQAAEQGLDKAQYTLGIMLYKAIGSNKLERESVQWLIRAAKQSVADAQYALGLIYATNNKFKDNNKAVKWWKLAAAQHHAKAQHNLAVMYLKGLGVAKDHSKAQYWFQQKAKHDDDKVKVKYSEGK